MSTRPIQKKQRKLNKKVNQLHKENAQKTKNLRKVVEDLKDDTNSNEFRLLALSMLSSTLDRVDLQSHVMKLEQRIVQLESQVKELQLSETLWKKFTERLFLKDYENQLYAKDITQFVKWMESSENAKPETIAAAIPVLIERNKNIEEKARHQAEESIYPRISSGELEILVAPDIVVEVTQDSRSIATGVRDESKELEIPFQDIQNWIEGFDWNIWASANQRKNTKSNENEFGGNDQF